MLATNNLMNSVAMAVAYGMLDVMHDVLHWSPRIIFAALGVASLIGAVIVVTVMPAIRGALRPLGYREPAIQNRNYRRGKYSEIRPGAYRF